jgi:hypothetical protein
MGGTDADVFAKEAVAVLSGTGNRSGKVWKVAPEVSELRQSLESGTARIWSPAANLLGVVISPFKYFSCADAREVRQMYKQIQY